MFINIKDVERMARTFSAQRLSPEYIRHFLQETYQVDDATVDLVFRNIGLITTAPGKGGAGKQAPGGPNKPTVKRREFT